MSHNDKNRQNMNTLAAALTAAALTAEPGTPTDAPEPAAALERDIFAPQNDDGETLAGAAADGLTVAQLFSGCVFRAVDKDVYKSDDGIRYSRKIADCMVELAHSGLYIPGSISQVQNLKDAEPHLEFAFLYSRQSRRSAIVVNDKGTIGKDLRDWKDNTIAAYETWATENGITAEKPVKTEYKHVVKGISLIGA